MKRFGFNDEELEKLATLNTPEKIQDYLDRLDYNWCIPRYECKSPRRVLRENNAHCLEGALFAAAARRVHKHPPQIVEMLEQGGECHVIAVFRQKGKYGAMAQSRTHHLKWRDPIFKNVRELVLSYFPFYAENGELVLRKYSQVINLADFDSMKWMTTENCLEKLGDHMDGYRHYNILQDSDKLRKVDLKIEEVLMNAKHQKTLEKIYAGNK